VVGSLISEPLFRREGIVAIKLIVADDQEVIRKGFARLLADEDVNIVAEAVTGSEAMAKTRKLKPDILIMDVMMPDTDGLDALERVRRDVPKTKVIMMSAYDNPTYMARSVAMGAAAFILKDAPAKEFVNTIRRVSRGETTTGDTAVNRMKAVLEKRPDPTADEVPLTKREYQVLRHLAYGLSNREIGHSLEISIETVKEHVQNILRKLDAADRTEAAVWAVKRGLV
jgi:DNA-binding NarL/FixJ family response regulator